MAQGMRASVTSQSLPTPSSNAAATSASSSAAHAASAPGPALAAVSHSTSSWHAIHSNPETLKPASSLLAHRAAAAPSPGLQLQSAEEALRILGDGGRPGSAPGPAPLTAQQGQTRRAVSHVTRLQDAVHADLVQNRSELGDTFKRRFKCTAV